jgi:WD40 repeat protein
MPTLEEIKLPPNSLGGIFGTFGDGGTTCCTGSNLHLAHAKLSEIDQPTRWPRMHLGVNFIAGHPTRPGILIVRSGQTLQRWDVAHQAILDVVPLTNIVVRSMAISSSGRFVAIGGDDTIEIREQGSGKLIHTFDGLGGTTLTVAFSPNEKLLASGSKDNAVRTWNLAPILAKWEAVPALAPPPGK